MPIRSLLCASALLAVSAPALASTSDDARAHFTAVAAGNVDTIMEQYTDKATFQWVGGPLNGAYSGAHAIRAVWVKFAKAAAPLQADVSNLDTNANAKGTTVTANVVFKGKKAIKVRYVLLYRDGKLVNEIWQIDPKLGASY